MSIESRSRQYGKVFDHWQIKEFLGSGSGGKTAVFRLVRSDSGWGVSALKVINLIEERGDIEELSDYCKREYEYAREECSKNAEQEVRLMDELRGNTNIVDYLDHTFVDWSDDSGFGRDLLIRMELLEDLRSELRSGKIFSEREALKIGRDICIALILCHRKSILHRDVKPENIFRNKDGNYKLGDFGVSRVLDACPGAVASTGIGTYEYWPAEQMTGRYDKRVDIYSLGLVLYELCNQNRLPFAASTYVTGKEVSMRLAGIPLPDPIEASPALAEVLVKACAFDPDGRYQSAEELLRALNQVIRSLQSSTEKTAIVAMQEKQRRKMAISAESSESSYNEYRTLPARADREIRCTSLLTEPTEKYAPFYIAKNIKENDQYENNDCTAEGGDIIYDKWDEEVDVDNWRESFREAVFTKQFIVGACISVIAAIVLVILIFMSIFRFIAINSEKQSIAEEASLQTISNSNEESIVDDIQNPSISFAAEVESIPDPTVENTIETVRAISQATLGVQGDLLMHSPVFNSTKQYDGSYDFQSIFRHCTDLISALDYTIINLETTFGGSDHPHIPNQSFSCPDELAEGAAQAGYDMFLTANNRSGDTAAEGLIRTLEISRKSGLDTLGTQMPGEKRYSIVDVNGIKIGMVAYTWAFSSDGSRVCLNGQNVIKDEGQVNYFTNQNPDKLYNEAEGIITDMKAEGAEVTMFFIHWGDEYKTTENAAQQKMAQQLCNIGFDVIVGGHAHVVQPVSLLESTVNPNHKTICIYSLGNAVSNQRSGFSNLFPEGYTEDGALFTVTFEKYSDGNVCVQDVDVIPTWVNMHSNEGNREYNILPLIKGQEGDWVGKYDLSSNQFAECQKSYSRTMGVVGAGLEKCKTYLENTKADRQKVIG